MHQKDWNQNKTDCNQIRMILITRMIADACSMQMSQLLFVSHDLVALVLLLLLLCLPLFFQALSGAAPAAPSLAALATVIAYISLLPPGNAAAAAAAASDSSLTTEFNQDSNSRDAAQPPRGAPPEASRAPRCNSTTDAPRAGPSTAPPPAARSAPKDEPTRLVTGTPPHVALGCCGLHGCESSTTC